MIQIHSEGELSSALMISVVDTKKLPKHLRPPGRFKERKRYCLKSEGKYSKNSSAIERFKKKAATTMTMQKITTVEEISIIEP